MRRAQPIPLPGRGPMRRPPRFMCAWHSSSRKPQRLQWYPRGAPHLAHIKPAARRADEEAHAAAGDPAPPVARRNGTRGCLVDRRRIEACHLESLAASLSWRVSRSKEGNARPMTNFANWTDEDSEHEEDDEVSEAEREADEQAQRPRDAAKRGRDAHPEADDD